MTHEELLAAWHLISHGHEGPCTTDPTGTCTHERVPRHPLPPRKWLRDGRYVTEPLRHSKMTKMRP